MSLLHDTPSMIDQQLYGFAIETVLIALMLPLVLIEAAGSGWGARLLNAPVLVLIGQISYGMYLYHPFVTHPIHHAVTRLTGVPALGAVAAVAGLMAVAWVSFRVFEQPMRLWLSPAATPATPRPADMGAAR